MLISVVITTHNTERFIEECLRSITKSSHQELNIVVVDDGSTDQTLATLHDWQARDDRIVVVSKPHQGRRAALQHAHEIATGELHCWVDSDDLIHPKAIERVAAAIDDTHQLAYSHRTVIDETGAIRGADQRNRIPYKPDQLLVDNMIFHLRMFTSDLFEQAGGVGDLESAIDWDMNLRMVEHTTPRCVPRSLYSYRVRNGQMTGRPDQKINGRRAVQNAIQRRQLPYKLITNQTGWHLKRDTTTH